jgi:ankyrin repeat protein
VDARFHPAMEAIKAGDAGRLRALVQADPELAKSRSSTSHPNLLQCLVLDAKDSPSQIEMARILVDAGADVNEPLVAAAGVDNAAAVAYLLDRGAAVDGTGGWSPLEEAIYWNGAHARDLLLQRGAKIRNLRIAAGLGRTDVLRTFFNADGSLRPEAGTVNWPWEQRSPKFASFRQDRQGIVDNALVYAAMHGHLDAAAFLLDQGAQLNTIPGGFDYSGSALHYASSTAIARWSTSCSRGAPMWGSRIRRSVRRPRAGRTTPNIPRSGMCCCITRASHHAWRRRAHWYLMTR